MRSLLHSRGARLITPLALLVLTASLFLLLIRTPWYIALAPAVLIHHRIGILLHEYVHGIPFRRRKYNMLVLSLFDGALISFGMVEVFRATHLAHHRWLNTGKDPAMQGEAELTRSNSFARALLALEGPQHLKYLGECLRGKYPYIRRRQIVTGAALSLVCLGLWLYFGYARVIVWLAVLSATTSVASSFRGAVEHHGASDSIQSTNEYRVLISLFNLNRHVDHHIHPGRPWYLLEYRTADPLPARSYWTVWYRVYLKRDYILLPPEAST